MPPIVPRPYIVRSHNHSCKARKGITIDDGWDQLNRRFMPILLIIMCIAVSIRQFAGTVIKCNGFTIFDNKFAEAHCWSSGLHTLKEAYDWPATFVPYPGIYPAEHCMSLNDSKANCPQKDSTQVFHLWYQWVPFYFLLAAAAFLMPYVVHRNFGIADIEPLVRLLDNPVESDQELQKMTETAATILYYKFDLYTRKQSLMTSLSWRHGLGVCLVLVKVLYGVVSLGCFLLTAEMFAIGDFKSYGLKWMTRMPNGAHPATDEKDRLFPKMVACEIKRWGASGLEEEQGMCVLAQNVINQYLFLKLWFCLVILIICNIVSIFSALIKLLFTYGSYRRLLSTAFLRDHSAIKHMYFSIGSSGRLILHILANNTAPSVFEDIIHALAPRIVAKKMRGL